MVKIWLTWQLFLSRFWKYWLVYWEILITCCTTFKVFCFFGTLLFFGERSHYFGFLVSDLFKNTFIWILNRNKSKMSSQNMCFVPSIRHMSSQTKILSTLKCLKCMFIHHLCKFEMFKIINVFSSHYCFLN